MDLWTVLEERFCLNKNQTALTRTDGNALTYGELLIFIKSIANDILQKIPAGSRVCLLNSHPYFDAVGVLGVLAAGCIVVPTSLNYGETNCCRIMDSAKPQLILTDMEAIPEVIENKVKGIIPCLFIANECREYDISIETVDKATDLAMLMFTSGTTGKPKGVMLTHDNLLSNLHDIDDYFHFTPNEHILIARPLYHAAVMTGEFLHALMCGSRITFYNEAFSPRRLLSYMEKLGCSVMCGTPTLFYHLTLVKKERKLIKLKKIVVSGECLLRQVADKLIEAFPDVEFYNVFGLTEASPRVSYLPPEYFVKKVGSVGLPLKSVTIMLADENGYIDTANKKGELVVAGPNVMKGYWNDPVQTEEKIKNGYLYTGDLAYTDDDGFLYILGRKDHMIIRAGLNIYPQEIENALMEDENIKEAIAWGEPEPKSGQRICIACVPYENGGLTEADIISACRSKLQPYQWPDEVYIVGSIPRNASGKIIRARPQGC